MDKEIMIYTYNGTLLSLQKKGTLAFAITWMNLGDIVLSEVS
jgi:hypothetical protein